jgi:hypothetical protein
MGEGSHKAKSLCRDQVRSVYSATLLIERLLSLSSAVGVTEANVKLLLAEEEAELAAQGVVALNEVNASAFVVAGLDLQDRQ